MFDPHRVSNGTDQQAKRKQHNGQIIRQRIQPPTSIKIDQRGIDAYVKYFQRNGIPPELSGNYTFAHNRVTIQTSSITIPASPGNITHTFTLQALREALPNGYIIVQEVIMLFNHDPDNSFVLTVNPIADSSIISNVQVIRQSSTAQSINTIVPLVGTDYILPFTIPFEGNSTIYGWRFQQNSAISFDIDFTIRVNYYIRST